MISYKEPTITLLNHALFVDAGVQVSVLNEYQNHPHVAGNKWWKLRDNITKAADHPSKTMITFGGAYSNHIYATAAACNEAGLQSIGIIRGETVVNKTLSFARAQGMKLEFVSRGDYQKKTSVDFNDWLTAKFGEHYLVPEGGTNEYAVNACKDWGRKLLSIDFDSVYVAVGTVGTVAGLIKGINSEREVIGVPVLKNDGHVEQAIMELIGNADNWKLLNEYHFGGYAKAPQELKDYCQWFRSQFNITIEPVYTGKLFRAVFDQIKKGQIRRGSKILVIHTGGLQYLP
jgi:1-aminocyclopropane-1-carboxylate deaminase